MKSRLFAFLLLAFATSASFQEVAQSTEKKITLSHLTSYETGIFNKSAAEIVVYNPDNHKFYVVNGSLNQIDVFQLAQDKTIPLPPLQLGSTEIPTSVATQGDLIAIAVHDGSQDHKPGLIILFTADHKRIAEFKAGSLPDMVTFSPDGHFLLAANEGEPGNNTDPDGSVTLIKLNRHNLPQSKILQLNFDHFNSEVLTRQGVRIAPGKSFPQDAEPEYIAVAADNARAWVSLQENNALAEIDLHQGSITRILPLGVKNHSIKGQGLDPNDKDGFNIITPPIFGMYMPDAIATINVKGRDYILTANEGDARDEEIKAKEARFDPNALSKNDIKSLGKLRISSTDGDIDHDGDIDKPHSYGARSFSIFSSDGKLVFDSGDDFERISAQHHGPFFNSDNDKANSGDSRSDNKGPEPEGITTGVINGHMYAFITLERIGGIMIYDVTNPEKPSFQSYYNGRIFNRKFDYDNPEDIKKARFLGPEGIYFIPGDKSPTSRPLLLVANEVSGNVEILNIN